MAVKGAAWRLLCHLLYWSGAAPLVARWLRRSRPLSWTLLTYHRIGPPAADGGPDLVDPRRFRDHLRYARARYEILPVGEALDRLRSGSPGPRPLLSLTFDDGYRDNVTTALPILQAEGCHATLYVTTEAILENLPPWPHRLEADLLAAAPERRSRNATARTVERAKGLPDDERRRICEEASRSAGDRGRRAAPMLGHADLERWRDAGMEIGSHTMTHRILSRLQAAERVRELEGSKRLLEKMLGIPIVHLAYPNGRASDWHEETVRDAAAAGYVSAVTTIEGVNGRDVDPFRIRRISVGDDPLPVFAVRLSGLFAGARAAFHSKGARGGRPLRIAFIGARGVGAAYSGIERYYEEVGSRLAARGHRLLVYCRPHFSPDVPVYRGMRVRRLPTVRSKHLETIVHSLLSTLDVCLRRVDLVQYHALGSSPLAVLPRLFGKKTIVSVRGLDWQRAKWGGPARRYLRLCERTSVYGPNATSVVSKTLRRHFEARFGRPARYIPNGVVQADPVEADTIAREWGLSPGRFFLYAGRLSPEKGLEGLIEAHRPLAARVRLVLAGGSSYSEDYMRRLHEIAGPAVLFTGFLRGRPLAELYSNALAFVLPSQMEGLSVALLEAMSYGLPVVASDIPENRELVDECGGFLFPVDDVAALSRILERVASDPVSARRVGNGARDRVREHFDWDRIALMTTEFYREVLDGSASRRAGTAAEVRPD